MKIILCLLLMIITYGSSLGTTKRVIKLGLFGVEPIDSLSPQYEQMVIGKIDSLWRAECAEPFYDRIRIVQKFRFTKLPYIQMFAIEDGNVTFGIIPDSNPYERFLFNSNDSTIYPFGGGSFRIAKFIKSYLPKIIAKGNSSVLELISLYFCTLNQNTDYYILSKKYDFIKLWDEVSNQKAIMRRQASGVEIKAENEKLRQRISEFEAIPQKGYILVNADTWSENKGTIESWKFRINENVFELYEHSILFIGMGPHYLP